MGTTTKTILLSLLVIIFTIEASYAVQITNNVKFYKLNKKKQLIRYQAILHATVAGCHNLLYKRKVHRFAQVGFISCRLFAQKNCNPASQISAMWSGKKYRSANIDINQPQINFLPGSKWVLAPDRNRIVRSWSCQV